MVLTDAVTEAVEGVGFLTRFLIQMYPWKPFLLRIYVYVIYRYSSHQNQGIVSLELHLGFLYHISLFLLVNNWNVEEHIFNNVLW